MKQKHNDGSLRARRSAEVYCVHSAKCSPAYSLFQFHAQSLGLP